MTAVLMAAGLVSAAPPDDRSAADAAVRDAVRRLATVEQRQAVAEGRQGAAETKLADHERRLLDLERSHAGVPQPMPAAPPVATAAPPAGSPHTFADRTVAGFGAVRVRGDVRPGTLVEVRAADGSLVATVHAGDEFFTAPAPAFSPFGGTVRRPLGGSPQTVCGPAGCYQVR